MVELGYATILFTVKPIIAAYLCKAAQKQFFHTICYFLFMYLLFILDNTIMPKDVSKRPLKHTCTLQLNFNYENGKFESKISKTEKANGTWKNARQISIWIHNQFNNSIGFFISLITNHKCKTFWLQNDSIQLQVLY